MIPRKVLDAIRTLAGLAGLAAAALAGAMEPPYFPPTGYILWQDFEGVQGIPPSWQVALGTWQADGQMYDSTAAASTAITTVFEYAFFGGAAEEDYDHVPVDEYTVSARLRNQQSGAAGLIGLVYSYIDPSNYREVAFSPTGTAYLRQMQGGQLEVMATASYPLLTPTQSLRVELILAHTGTTVRVNGVSVFTKASVPYGIGQVGFSTYNTTAKFDDISIGFPFGQQPLTETFSDGVADGFLAPATFVVSNGVYVDTAVRQTDVSYAPLNFGFGNDIVLYYTVHVRMLNPYGGSGNLIGLQLDSQGDTRYTEVVFSPTGLAQVRLVDGATIQVLHSASHSIPRNTWFTVTLELNVGLSVNVDGKPLFTHVPAPLFNGRPTYVALTTHWTPGRFDDFRFGYDGPVTAAQQNFDGPLSTGSVRSGTWNTQGGTLNDVSASIADIVIPTDFRCDSDYRYRARMLNQYVSSGNLIGMVLGYESQQNYVEAVFAPTGQAYLHQYLDGKRYRLATGTHAIAPNVWFNVEVLRKSGATTVSINGTPIFRNVQLGDFSSGPCGVVSHWSKARFDTLSIQEAP